jgi:hypothetical protein
MRVLAPEFLVFENDVGGVSYSETLLLASVTAVLMLELIEDRLNASSITFSSSVLTFRASLWMYFVGLSGLRNHKRGLTAGFATSREGVG